MNAEELKQGRDKQSKAIPGDWRLRHNAFELLELPPPPQCEIDDDDFTVWLRNNADALLSAAEENAALRERADRCEGELACACDMLNTWARESQVAECKDPYRGLQLREVVDRLWSKLSGQASQMRAENERLREAVIQLGARG